MNISDFKGKVEGINVRVEQLKDLVFRVLPVNEDHYTICYFDVQSQSIKLNLTNSMFHPVDVDALKADVADVNLIEALYTHMQHKTTVARWLNEEFEEPDVVAEFPLEKNNEAIEAFQKYVKQLKVMEPSDCTAEEYGIPENLLG